MAKDAEFYLEFDEAIAREVYAYFGLASYQAQCFEKGLFNISVCLLAIASKGKLTKKQFNEAYDKLETRTIGPLLKELKKSIELSEEKINIFSLAHEKRNYLAHSFFWENAPSMTHEDGQRKLIYELNTLVELFSKADDLISEIVWQLNSKMGIPEDRVQEFMDRMISEEFAKFGK